VRSSVFAVFSSRELGSEIVEFSLFFMLIFLVFVIGEIGGSVGANVAAAFLVFELV